MIAFIRIDLDLPADIDEEVNDSEKERVRKSGGHVVSFNGLINRDLYGKWRQWAVMKAGGSGQHFFGYILIY